jgi:tRNA (adenine57-N1/adenine58-N1)-methyltransferase|uniref:tRNA (Adenine-N1)-methyltransferase n=1 Tax=Ignisphaera aggregans TaxID=334771 RepID=A0A7J2U4D0_9CREN
MTSVLSHSNALEYGKEVLIYFDNRRKFLVKLEQGKKISSDKGTIPVDSIVNKEIGSQVTTSLNVKAWILQPLLIDYLEKGIKRVTQVIYPKDLGLIILMLGLESGYRVLEAGVGSGNTTMVLAHFVKPQGHVFGYENRKEFIEIAKGNLARMGLDKYVTIKYGDIRKGVDERGLDAAIIDIPDPWEALDSLYLALKPSASIAFFIPSMQQLLKLFEAIDEHKGFIDIRAYETLLREIELSRRAIRPSTYMVGHTGFILFARKIIKSSQ